MSLEQWALGLHIELPDTNELKRGGGDILSKLREAVPDAGDGRFTLDQLSRYVPSLQPDFNPLTEAAGRLRASLPKVDVDSWAKSLASTVPAMPAMPSMDLASWADKLRGLVPAEGGEHMLATLRQAMPTAGDAAVPLDKLLEKLHALSPAATEASDMLARIATTLPQGKATIEEWGKALEEALPDTAAVKQSGISIAEQLKSRLPKGTGDALLSGAQVLPYVVPFAAMPGGAAAIPVAYAGAAAASYAWQQGYAQQAGRWAVDKGQQGGAAVEAKAGEIAAQLRAAMPDIGDARVPFDAVKGAIEGALPAANTFTDTLDRMRDGLIRARDAVPSVQDVKDKAASMWGRATSDGYDLLGQLKTAIPNLDPTAKYNVSDIVKFLRENAPDIQGRGVQVEELAARLKAAVPSVDGYKQFDLKGLEDTAKATLPQVGWGDLAQRGREMWGSVKGRMPKVDDLAADLKTALPDLDLSGRIDTESMLDTIKSRAGDIAGTGVDPDRLWQRLRDAMPNVPGSHEFSLSDLAQAGGSAVSDATGRVTGWMQDPNGLPQRVAESYRRSRDEAYQRYAPTPEQWAALDQDQDGGGLHLDLSGAMDSIRSRLPALPTTDFASGPIAMPDPSAVAAKARDGLNQVTIDLGSALGKIPGFYATEDAIQELERRLSQAGVMQRTAPQRSSGG